MNKFTQFSLSLLVLTIIGLFASNQVSAQIIVCDNGSNLSYDQAKDALASGELFITRTLESPGIAVTIDNNTPCNLPTSLATYKMFGPYSLDTQSEQEFFDGTSLYNVGPHSTEVLRVSLPECAAQYDLWYGAAPTVLVNNQPYENMLLGDQVGQNLFCVLPPIVPIAATLSTASSCVVPGTSISFTSTVTGDGITSKTLEKDTNDDGSFGEVASFGAGAGTNTFSTSEPSSYSGTYILRLMVNGVERDRERVTVNTSCAPVVLPPPPPPATLRIIKTVIDDNGGTGLASHFNLHVKLSGIDVPGSPAIGAVSPGTLYSLPAGTYVVSEDANFTPNSNTSLYAQSFSGDCNSNGSVTLLAGETKTCTVINNDIAPVVVTPTSPIITVIKQVINDNGRTRTVADFPLFVSGTPVTSGVPLTLGAAGNYTVTETADSNYARSFSGDCNANGNITFAAGENKTCTVINNDIAPVVVSGGSSGGGMLSGGAVYPISIPLSFVPVAIPVAPPAGQVLGVMDTPTIYSFPKTGLGPLGKIIPLNVFMAILVVLLALVAFAIDRLRRREIQHELIS